MCTDYFNDHILHPGWVMPALIEICKKREGICKVTWFWSLFSPNPKRELGSMCPGMLWVMLFPRNWSSHLIHSSGPRDSHLSSKHEAAYAVFDRTQLLCVPCLRTLTWLCCGIAHPRLLNRAWHFLFLTPARGSTESQLEREILSLLLFSQEYWLQAHNSVPKLCPAFHFCIKYELRYSLPLIHLYCPILTLFILKNVKPLEDL